MSMKSCLSGTWKHQRWKQHPTHLYTTLNNIVTNCLVKHDITSTNMAIATHSKNGQLNTARKVFDEMPQRTVVSWNTMISTYSKWGRYGEALNILSSMHFNNVKLNETTFCSGLSACARLPSFYAGKQLHGLVLRCGLESFQLVGSALLYFYAKCCEIEEARRVFDVLHEGNALLWSLMLVCYVRCNLLDDALDVFDKMPVRDIVAWTALISGFSKTDGGLEKALEFFCLMRRRGEAEANEFTLDCVIRVCGRLDALREGMTVHGLVIKCGFEFEHWISGALIEFYCACKAIDDGKKVYRGLSNPGISSSNSLIEGLVEMGRIEEAESVFNTLVEKDPSTYNLMIKAYSLVNRFEDSVELFFKMPRKVLASFNTMISVYSRNRDLNKACALFEAMKEERDIVTWNSMISGYIHNNQHENALNLYKTMHTLSIKGCRSTFSSLFHACSCLGSLQMGKLLHAQLAKTPLTWNVYVGTSLVDMYSKCGSVNDARLSFISIVNPNVAAYTALINGYAHHGMCTEAILLFENMVNIGVKPNVVTFVGVLSACAHAGRVNDGMKFLHQMKENYNITPTIEHFTYAVDFLGQSGRIRDAEELISKMPFEPDGVMLGALLKSCWVWFDLEVGQRVAQKMVNMDPKLISAAYVIMSNIYSGIGKWKEKMEIRRILTDSEVNKDRGYSWVEVNNEVFVFSVEDRSHPCYSIIFSTLMHLIVNIYSNMLLDSDSHTFNSI
ncbi:putative tetratricopeptide-like helical domain superfamily [Helianthus annuus]|uniref:Putative tetratricopeptide-like helical domain-containing protein n=1 Tax=Helianthus annuus TaxID=4232 RepID=A0A251SSQ9_HELAN|nr:putative pentatricopeptide repeat-containing protein At5g59200, chloroplastic [Helianthus annuus]KAF5772269.1 putative tetratricopeptide-like helical domain superfamily [Helianthus annuus]KAJ0848114.1 putative tetratricopeptide-like helical domain superfamily [Helianthus annuus]KAJ0857063.1 putative tetratricopeptide-like helical domain superfamily [Helianthus annuus]